MAMLSPNCYRKGNVCKTNEHRSSKYRTIKELILHAYVAKVIHISTKTNKMCLISGTFCQGCTFKINLLEAIRLDRGKGEQGFGAQVIIKTKG